MLKKPAKDGMLHLCTVLDTWKRNANTQKLTPLLPDMEMILCNIVSHHYWSLLNGKGVYKQIKVTLKDVPKTLFTTPDNTMISHAMQISNCNASTTYQSIMNHIFMPFISVFINVYLDNIVVCLCLPEVHIKNVIKIINTL